MPKPYVVEVESRVAPSRLWRALTDTTEIPQWFGWDASTLADEIQYIFVDHSSADGDRMRLDADDMDLYLEVAPSGANSVVRAVQAGGDPEDGEYDGMKSGWIAFLHQLKRYVEEHTNETRRTVFLKGVGNSGFIVSALQDRLEGETWFSDDHTLVVATPDFGPGLGVLNTTPPLGADERGESNFTLTTYGLSDREFDHLTEQWLEWWQVVADDSELVTGRVKHPVAKTLPGSNSQNPQFAALLQRCKKECCDLRIRGRSRVAGIAWMPEVAARRTDTPKCEDCYFRKKMLCALDLDEACMTFRADRPEGLVPPKQPVLLLRPPRWAPDGRGSARPAA